MVQDLRQLKESPSQTAGPYVHIGTTPNFAGIKGVYDRDLGDQMVQEGVGGERIKVSGHVIDGSGTKLRDAMLEIWQADANGLYNCTSETRGKSDPKFTGWGRTPTNLETGAYAFDTVKPGQVPYPDGRMQAPHINFWIVARGINLGLNTRMYFADEEAANAADPILSRVEHKVRIPTVLAQKVEGGYQFDIHLQGPNETIFFDI